MVRVNEERLLTNGRACFAHFDEYAFVQARRVLISFGMLIVDGKSKAQANELVSNIK
ncbi:hypothetical protein D9M71_793450 [compost metagenome]